MSEQEWSDTKDRTQGLGEAVLDGAPVEDDTDPAWQAIQDRQAEPTLARPATAGSLRDRMRKRAEEVSQRTSDMFPVPLFDDVIAVELKVISWAKSEQFVTRNQRIPTQAMLYTAGDEIVAATVGFHEIKEDGSLELVEDAHTWSQMATGVAGLKLPDGTGERVALIAMCTDQGVIALNGLYRRWLGGADTGLKAVQAELKRDF